MWRAILMLLLLAPRAWALTANSNCTASTGWATTPLNALDSDADVAQTAITGQPALLVTGCAPWSPVIPSGSTIQGIQVHVVGCGAGTSGQRAIDVNLVGVGTCTAKAATPQTQCATFTDNLLGGTGDLWSCTSMSEANVNASTFGVSVKTNTSNSSNVQAQYVWLIATYATTTTTTTTTSTTTTVPAGCTAVDYQEGTGSTPFSDNVPDTWLSSQNPTFNNGADTTQQWGDFLGSFAYHVILQYNLGSGIPGGNAINDAYLVLNVASVTTPTGTGSVSRLLRSDWDEANASWNIYKVANNWTTAGAESNGNDFTTTDQITFTNPTATGLFNLMGLTTLTQDALTNRSGALILKIRDVTETGSSIVSIASSDNATTGNRPKLHVVYCPSGTTTTTTTLPTAAIPIRMLWMN